MKTYSFYSTASGMFDGLRFRGHEADALRHCPPGCALIEGAHDRLSQRVDLQSGQVIDYQPAKPEDTELQVWQWIGRRWVAVLTVAGLRAQLIDNLSASALALERGTDRLVREAVLSAPAHPAYARMAAIEASVAPIRAAITAAMAASTKEELDAIKAQLSQGPA